ncbi:hypothetical protein [Robbsia sp. KACC 23696]|uniref:hypothetical protein n=1 Tax=Robbsia sp. KACC 23696 TaxID=3149231 RepID=UPI00325AB783
MTAAALHRHTPEGLSGAPRREDAAQAGAMNTPNLAAASVSDGAPALPDNAAALPATVPAVSRTDAKEAQGAASDDERVPADATLASTPAPAKRAALPLGLPADILALDLNLGELPETPTPEQTRPIAPTHAVDALPADHPDRPR